MFKFMKFEATPGEKHLGICTIKAYDKIILRYKIVPNKEGGGWFPCEASYKMPSVAGQDVYAKAFMLDSNCEHEELMNLIRAHVKSYLNAPQVDNQSVFSAPVAQPQAQPNPNYYQQAQPQPNYYNPNNGGSQHQVDPMRARAQDVPNGELPF